MVINLLIFIGSVAFLTVIYSLIYKTIYNNDKTNISIDLDTKKGCCKCISTETDSISSDMLDEECHEEIQMSVKTGANTNVSSTEPNKADETNAAIKLHVDKDLPLEDGRTLIVTDKISQEPSSKSTPKETNNKPKRSTPAMRKRRPSERMTIHEAPGRKNNKKHTRKITIILLSITIVFIVSYLPFIVITILDSVSDDYWFEMSNNTELFHNFLLRLYLVNNMANPIIYGFWDKKFRNECVKLIKSLFCFNKEEN